MLIDNELGVRVGGRSHAALVGGASQAGQRRKEGEANVKGPKKIFRCFYR